MMRGLTISRCCEWRRRTEETAQWAGVIWDKFPEEGGDCCVLYRKFVVSWGLLGEGRRRKHRDVAFNSQRFSQGDRLPLVEGISCHGKQVSKA